ncbi:hypothetical protein L6R53_15935 [Myxococcota bacterium]|nr:hypothetical protein [Myxococcota bacterium]
MDKPDSLFDVRTARRNLARGLITQAEFDAMLASLEDSADKAVKADTRFVRRAWHDAGEYTDED